MPAKARTAPRRRTLSPSEIDRLRQTYVGTIATARSLGERRNTLLDKAQCLLTAHWGEATWDSRETILKTVDWLLRVALHNQPPTPRAQARPIAPAGSIRRDPVRHH
jgi:hypothetical protein